MGMNIDLTEQVTGVLPSVNGGSTGTNTGDVTITNSAEIDFTLTGQDITASLIAGSVDETKLDASINTSLDLADSALQSGAAVDLSTAQTVAGIKTFSSSPIVPTPTADLQVATKKYVDDNGGNALAVLSDVTGVAGADKIDNIISLTQAEYDAITPDAATIYNITDGVSTIVAANDLNSATTVVNVSGATAPLSGQTLTAIDSTNATWQNITAKVNTIVSSATPTPNGDTADIFTITALAINTTIAAITGTLVNGQKLIMRIKDDGTARTIAWNAIYRAGDVALPTTTVVNKTMYIGLIYNSVDVKWDLLAYLDNL